jgi:hypothetical protein
LELGLRDAKSDLKILEKNIVENEEIKIDSDQTNLKESLITCEVAKSSTKE